MAGRIIYSVVIILAVLWLPSWLSIIFGLAGIIRYHHFYEILAPALIFDFLYAAPGVTPVGFPLMFSVFGLAAVYLAEDFKTMVMISR
jgi:hypothetical protein